MKRKLSLLSILIIMIFIGCADTVKIVKFDTRPEAPFKGDSVTLYWIVQNATEVTLDDMPVAKDSGGYRVLLNESRTFTLKAKNSQSERTNNLNIIGKNR